MFLRRLTAATLVCTTLGLPLGTPVAAAPRGTVGGGPVAVGASTELLVANKEGVVRTRLTFSNTDDAPWRVSLRSVSVRPLDDGRVQLIDQPDPVWGSASTLVSAVTVPPQGHSQMPLTITVPSGVKPDFYLLGYLADAASVRPAGAATVVRSQVSALVTVQLPGWRPRRVDVESRTGGFLHIGREFTGTFRVRNTGVTAALVHGQVWLNSAVDKSNLGVVAPERSRSLLSAGTSRTVTYRWTTGRLWSYIRPTVEVAYSNDTAAPSTVKRVGPPMLLVPWQTVVVIAAFLAVLIVLVVRFVMRRSGGIGGPRGAAGSRWVATVQRRVRAGAVN